MCMPLSKWSQGEHAGSPLQKIRKLERLEYKLSLKGFL